MKRKASKPRKRPERALVIRIEYVVPKPGDMVATYINVTNMTQTFFDNGFANTEATGSFTMDARGRYHEQAK